MPTTARSRLPHQVQLFLEDFAESGDHKAAAVNVGVHPRNAERFYRETLDHPDAREAFDQIIRTRFSHAKPLAMNLLLAMVRNDNKEFGERVRLDAAKDLLVRAERAEAAIAKGAGAKDLAELSRDELKAIVNAGEAELANRAKLVENRPVDSAITTQLIDLES